MFLFISKYQDPWYLILGFVIAIIIMLVIDLNSFKVRDGQKVNSRDALIWSIIWILVAFLFAGVIYFLEDKAQASDFVTAYLIERALSVDNLFVFILVFKFFKIPEKFQNKALAWGIIGAIFLRVIFIYFGVALINMTYIPDFQLGGILFHKVNIILTVFGLFLIYAGIHSWKDEPEDQSQDFSGSFGIRMLKFFYPVTDKLDGERFFTRINGRRTGTRLLMVVSVIMITDLVFAVDSIPAIFTISTDPFILYSSNIFAILGLRAMYFLLQNFINYFDFLKYGLAIILSFIGVKMVIAPFFHISSIISLGVVAGVLVLSMVLSYFIDLKPKTEDKE
jgi:tellurite resistance protein TerC